MAGRSRANVAQPFRAATTTIFAAALCLYGASGLAHDRISTKVSWDREIAPIVKARCVSCHAPGGRAPMPLTTYEEVRPWARAIKEEVLTRRMPKWHVVRGYGDFTNDPTLSSFEIALIAAWADGGAPKAPVGKALTPSTTSSDHLSSPSVPPTRVDSHLRRTELPCSSRILPRGRVVGIAPMMDAGASLQLTVQTADGFEQPLLWVRDFDPKFPETYWLRSPLNTTSTVRMSAAFSGPCRLTVLLSPGTAQ
jgi:hypothetical protein